MAFKNKKGQFAQIIVAVVLLALFLFGAVFVYQASDMINSEIQNDAEFSNEAKTQLNDLNTTYPSLFDGIGMFVFVGLWIFCLVSAYYSDSNPLWLIVALFIIASLGVVGMILNNVWGEIETDATMVSYAASFPMMSFLLSKYLLVVIFMGFSSVMVALYKNQGGYG